MTLAVLLHFDPDFSQVLILFVSSRRSSRLKLRVKKHCAGNIFGCPTLQVCSASHLAAVHLEFDSGPGYNKGFRKLVFTASCLAPSIKNSAKKRLASSLVVHLGKILPRLLYRVLYKNGKLMFPYPPPGYCSA